MIRIEAIWLATTPLDMRAGTDSVLARIVQVFGAAHPHTANLIVIAESHHSNDAGVPDARPGQSQHQGIQLGTT